MYSESQLVERARKGDRAAFDSLVYMHKGRAFALAFHFIGNAEDAKDVLQDAFVRAYVGMRSFRGEAGFYTWLCRIVINLCRDFIRKKAVRSRIFTGPLETEDGETFEAADDAPGAADAAINKELKAGLDRAMERLPERQRSAFIMRYVEDMSVREIATTLGCGESTVKVHLFRAIRGLRCQLSKSL